jgi:LemA protein
MGIGLIILLVAVGLFFLYFVATYNRFINLKNGIESNLKQINVALKKRLDLIGQVLDSVKGQMKFEKGTLTEITAMRSNFSKAAMNVKDAKKVDLATSNFVSGLNVQLENYPNLRSNEQVKQLIDSINGLEEEVSRLRYVYNNTVQEFNTKRQTIPSNIVAGICGFSKTSYLEFEEGESLKKAPKIDL